MAFPVVTATSTSLGGIPARSAGDLVLMFNTVYYISGSPTEGNKALTIGSLNGASWSLLGKVTGTSASTGYLLVYYVRAPISGSATSVSVTAGSGWTLDAGGVTLVISGAHTSTAPAGAFATGVDPPALNPSSWDVEDTLWLAACGSFLQPPTNVPSGYTNAAAATFLQVGRRNNAAASENPGSFSGSTPTGPTVATIAIRPNPNASPTANAGPDQEVEVGATVQLDGTGSSDPEDGTSLTYSWTVIDDGGTGLTTGDLVGANTATPSFTAPSLDPLNTPWTEGFESGSRFNAGATSDFTTDGTSPHSGSQIYRHTRTDGTHSFLYDNTQVYRAAPGWTYEGWLRVPSSVDPHLASLLLGYTGSGSNGYTVILDNRNMTGGSSSFQIRLNNSTTPIASSGDLGLAVNTWYRAVVEWTGSGITARLYDGSGTLLSTLNTSDTTYTTGYVGIHAVRNGNFDDLTLTPVASSTDIVLRLQVTDSGSQSATDTVTITVNEPDVIVIGDVTGSGGVVVGGAATVEVLDSLPVTGSGGIEVGGAATIQTITPTFVTGVGGALVGGESTVRFVTPVFVTADGGVMAGGSADSRFVHSGQVASNIVVEWDFDNDGDFDEPEEDITRYVLSAETFTGRDWPSLLTGRAGPGKLRVSLRNDDDRFSYFNASSPLGTAPFSLTTGRKVRVRTTSAGNPDPVLLVRDRFRRDDGALGQDETGLSYVEPLADAFTIATNRAVATGEGEPHVAVLDVGAADYYVQAQVTVVGITGNAVGVVYRYVDSSNYSLCVLDVQAAAFQLVNVVAGVWSIVAGQGVEVYSGATLGVLVEGDTVTGYLEGVPLLSGVAVNASASSVGIFAEWTNGDDRPEIDNLFAWSGLPAQTEGVLWTGDISELVASVTPGPEKVANVAGEGWLSKLATQRINPPASINGRKTGLLVGNVLAGSMLLHPPGPIDEGDVTTGAFAVEDNTAMEVARRVEETEYGFLYETQEGPIAFESRTGREGSTSVVTFSDAPGAKFGYHRLEPYDWRREVFNRVVAGVSPWIQGAEAVLFTDPGPYSLSSGQTRALQASYEGTVVRWTGHTRDVAAPGPPTGVSVDEQSTSGSASSTFNVAMPSTVNAGDLLLIVADLVSGTPAGWTRIGFGYPEVFAKVATGSEDGTNVTLTSGSGAVAWAVQVVHVSGWHGSLDGVAVSSYASGSDRFPNPPALSPPWGSLPTLYIAAYTAFIAEFEGSVSPSGIPAGYGNAVYARDVDSEGFGTLIGTARRSTTGVSSENPGTFTMTVSGEAEPLGWDARTIAIRGPATGSTSQVTSSNPSGSNPEFTIGYVSGLGGTSQVHENIEVSGVPLVQGDQQLVQADDFVSQDEHNAIRTYTNPANLFATVADAQEYAELVLATHADDRPILSMSFYASRSAAYRAQAVRRRVGDRITLVADHNTGFGISGDFFIESISHRWSHGLRLWETTWELSPA